MQLPLQITARNISLSEVAEDDIRDKAAGLDHDDDGIMSRRNSVLHRGFERLEIGTEVRFAEEEGEQGPQASTVAIVGTRGL